MEDSAKLALALKLQRGDALEARKPPNTKGGA
jgi:hypothetical protein